MIMKKEERHEVDVAAEISKLMEETARLNRGVCWDSVAMSLGLVLISITITKLFL